MTISTAQIPLAKQETQQSVDVSLVAAGENSRCEIERFIKIIFRKAYGAQTSHFLPYLLSIHQDETLLAALGIRPAVEGELFLEVYLDRGIESVLAEKVHTPIDRSRIVEVGNLASAHGGGARALIVTLAAYLKGAAYEWAVFTATPKVRNNFAKLGIELIPLANADKNCLGEEQHNWGSYYDQGPIVVAANVSKSAAAICCALENEQLFPTAQQLWDDAHRAGRQGRLWQPPQTLNGRWPEWSINEQIDFCI